ncbi:MAG: sensor histidine kinase [Flavobacteriales bacterium]|nr:sensor histidine kinase [Flavobacteriales bacterium]
MNANKIIQRFDKLSKNQRSKTELPVYKLTKNTDQNAVQTLAPSNEVELIKRKLEKAMHEKEILLKEIHHRVKNHLQQISSLIKLESYSNPSKDSQKFLANCRLKVDTIASVHELLCRSDDDQNISYKEYLDKLIHQFIDIHSLHPNQLKVHCEIPEIKGPSGKISSLGLLINEILSNSIKHQSNPQKSHHLFLKVEEKENGWISIRIGDDGPGYSDELFTDEKDSFGLQLIRDLVAQLNGSIKKLKHSEVKGTHYEIQLQLN